MKRAVLSLMACATFVAGCGADSSDETSADSSSAAPEPAREVSSTPAPDPAEAQAAEAQAAEPAPAARRRGPRVKLRDSQLGPVLFDGKDRAVYLFTRDRKGKSRCYGACAEAWPPFYAKGRPRAARGVDRALLGTVKRRGGRRQVTYKDQPLYFYVHDPKGQVLCNDIVGFGGTWFALDADGDPPA